MSTGKHWRLAPQRVQSAMIHKSGIVWTGAGIAHSRRRCCRRLTSSHPQYQQASQHRESPAHAESGNCGCVLRPLEIEYQPYPEERCHFPHNSSRQTREYLDRNVTSKLALHIRLFQMIRQSPLVGTSERLWSQPGFWPTSIPSGKTILSLSSRLNSETTSET